MDIRDWLPSEESREIFDSLIGAMDAYSEYTIALSTGGIELHKMTKAQLGRKIYATHLDGVDTFITAVLANCMDFEKLTNSYIEEYAYMYEIEENAKYIDVVHTCDYNNYRDILIGAHKGLFGGVVKLSFGRWKDTLHISNAQKTVDLSQVINAIPLEELFEHTWITPKIWGKFKEKVSMGENVKPGSSKTDLLYAAWAYLKKKESKINFKRYE